MALGRIDKLKARILTIPKDFTYDEASALLNGLGFLELSKGKTSGSRVEFIKIIKDDNGNETMEKLLLHKPHPQKELKAYAVRQLVDGLKGFGEL